MCFQHYSSMYHPSYSVPFPTIPFNRCTTFLYYPCTSGTSFICIYCTIYKKKDNFIQILQDKKWALNEVNNVSLNLTVLALQGIQLLLDAGQLALQGLHDCSVVILHLPHLFSISLALGLNLRQLVGLSLGQVRPQGDIF